MSQSELTTIETPIWCAKSRLPSANVVFNFQIENGILLPSLRPMLPLLDLHGIKRLDFHNSVLEDLREKLVRKEGQIWARIV